MELDATRASRLRTQPNRPSAAKPAAGTQRRREEKATGMRRRAMTPTYPAGPLAKEVAHHALLPWVDRLLGALAPDSWVAMRASSTYPCPSEVRGRSTSRGRRTAAASRGKHANGATTIS